MPRRLYTLDDEKNQILEVTWKRNLKKLNISLNNKFLGEVNDRKSLTEGKEFEISHDKRLSVKLIKEMYIFTELELLVNGIPVENSMTHPVKKLNDIFILIMFIVSINLVFGLLAALTGSPVFERLGIGYWNIIYAGIFVMLGLLVKEKKSMFAMLMIIVLMLLDCISLLVFTAEQPGELNPTGPFFFKIILILYLFRGIKAINSYKKMTAEKIALEKVKEELLKKTPLSQQVTQDHSKFMPGDHSAYMPGEE